MIRITLQLIPDSYLPEREINLNSSAVNKSNIEYNKTGWSSVSLSQSHIEFDSNGHIRYTTEVDSITEETLRNEYNRAIHLINNIFNENRSDYRLSIILKDLESVERLVDYEDYIRDFGAELLGSPDIEYSELGSERFKFSFTKDAKTAKV